MAIKWRYRQQYIRCMKAYIKRYLPHPFSPTASGQPPSHGLPACWPAADRVDEWIPDRRTASVTLHVPMADIRSTHTRAKGVQGR